MNKPVKLNIALKGGGSHGAFTWGVLNRLLEEPGIEIEGISGTSSGAVNGSLVANCLSRPGQNPCFALDNFWTELGKVFSSIFMPSEELFKLPMLGTTDSNYALDMFLNMTQSFAPYLFNPDDMNPLRDLLKKSITFSKLRNNKDIRLYIAATNVKTCRLKVFSREELTVEHLLASACLPTLHHPVKIKGETYWDGGFTGNPVLYPLIFNCKSPDVLIVLLQPGLREKIPETGKAIRERIYELAFYSNFMREMRAISFSKRIIRKNRLLRGPLERRLDKLRIHIIHADEELKTLDQQSRFNASPEMLQKLRDSGYRCADQWLRENREFIGKKSTTSLDEYSDYPA